MQGRRKGFPIKLKKINVGKSIKADLIKNQQVLG